MLLGARDQAARHVRVGDVLVDVDADAHLALLFGGDQAAVSSVAADSEDDVGLLTEESDRLLKGWTVEIVATDLNDHSVETAKAGVYGDYALRTTADYFRRKYFSAVDEKKLQVLPEVKKMITFSRLNLQEDSRMLFMKSMDLIFCCNVLIYFDGASKSKVINHFFSNLNFGGYFFLGTSESLMKLNDQFRLIHFPGTIGYGKPSPGSGKV